jgi:nuclear pore complex protein Nup210
VLQNDDVNVYDYRSDYWRTVSVSNDIAVKHGWRNTKLLKAYSQGIGNLTASVSYPGGADDRKEVITVVQEVMVCDQVKFTLGNESGVILLPWAPGVHQDAKLKAVGGWKLFLFAPI